MSSLLDRIKARIKAHGPLSIADYMTMALTDPEDGYYMRHDPLGADFITAPEISQIFGELIGAWLARQWEVMGKPKAALVEMGPGRGTLMADALRATKRISGFHEAVTVHLVEASPALRQKQWHALAGKHPNVEWHESLDDVPQKPLLLVANEFFDALPIRQFVFSSSPLEGEDRGGGCAERMVGVDAKGNLQFTTAPYNIPPTLPSPSRGEGIYEVSESSLTVATHISHHVKTHGGVALIVDYGYAQSEHGDTLQAMRAHQYEDVLADPGACDITAHVDFAALRAAALNSGAGAFGPIPQAVFLTRIGAAVRAASLCSNVTEEQKHTILSGLQRLISPQQMGALFKVLCIAHPKHPRPEGLQPC